jgi:hypothetical protein
METFFELSGLGTGQQHDLAYGQFIQFGIAGFTSLSSFLVLNPEASYEEIFCYRDCRAATLEFNWQRQRADISIGSGQDYHYSWRCLRY